MTDKVISLDEATSFAIRHLVAANTCPDNAADVAKALVMAEADGLGGHGLSRLPSYCAQAKSGKADGHAKPQLTQPAPSSLLVDAQSGFAYPALKLGIAALIDNTKSQGLSGLGIFRSNHCGAAGHQVERLADAGLIGMMFANAPASIAPWGGNKPLYGTNPIAFSCPQNGSDPLVIDMSVSKVARGNLMAASQRGEAIPEGWALDKDGNTTTNADEGLAGSMVPMGDAKGTALALMVEILCATLVGANHSTEVSSYFDGRGDPPGSGQFVLAINPGSFSAGFGDRLKQLIENIEAQEGTRLPGARRFENRRKAQAKGILLRQSVVDALNKE